MDGDKEQASVLRKYQPSPSIPQSPKMLIFMFNEWLKYRLLDWTDYAWIIVKKQIRVKDKFS